MTTPLQAWFTKLRDKDEAARREARRALCSLEPADKRAVPELIEFLTSDERACRCWAARGLSAIGSEAKDAVPALIDVLTSQDEDFRFWVVTALSSIGSEAKDATPALLELLEDPVFGIRQAAADAVSRIAPTGEGVVPALVKTLEGERNGFVREEIVRALGRIGTKDAVAAVVGRLTDPKPDVRQAAVLELKVLGSTAKAAIPALREFLANEPEGEVRGQAETALRWMTGDTNERPG